MGGTTLDSAGACERTSPGMRSSTASAAARRAWCPWRRSICGIPSPYSCGTLQDNEAVSTSGYDEFLKAHPEYASTRALDALRASEYGRLDAQRHVYLDYTGAGLHAESQIRQHAALLNNAVFG